MTRGTVLAFVATLAVGLILGLLVGRRNPDKADLAAYGVRTGAEVARTALANLWARLWRT